MGRHHAAKCKLCRGEGEKLFLKGSKCYGPKCILEKKQAAGARRQRSSRTSRRRQQRSEYGMQLREKQKLKRMYGLFEKQFRRYFEVAEKQRGITGDNLVVLLERRLDNVVFRLGFAVSRGIARQLISHGHVSVNGRKTDIPSFLVRENDVVSVRERSRELVAVKEGLDGIDARGVPEWLELDKESFEGRVRMIPVGGQIEAPVRVQLVVGLYSR